jgi:hypothetical protein
MLQKNYWLDHSSNKEVKREMRFRTLFCKYPFPSGAIFYNRAFMMFDGGRVSASNAWTISINECSILRPGSVVNLADEITEQIRRLLILKTNLLFTQSPDEIDNFYNKYSFVINEISANTILPSFFSDDEHNLRETIQDLNSWVDRILSFDRKLYKSFCTALAAYEKALQVLSSDPSLSYSLLVFVLEALANSDSDYQATWDHISPETKNKFESLFEDSRFSSIDSTWTDKLKQVILDTLVPGAIKRFTKFTLDHIPSGFYDSQTNKSKSPIRYSRISSSVQNAYSLRSIDEVIQHNKMGFRFKNFENLVVNIICDTAQQYSGEESEKLLEHHIKKRKIRLPFRVEIACMIEVARIFQNESVIEKRDKWLNYVYGDSARYPDFQSLIKDALACPEIIIEPQAILDFPYKPSFKDAYNSLINEDYWQE